jgi:hypothetical protein
MNFPIPMKKLNSIPNIKVFTILIFLLFTTTAVYTQTIIPFDDDVGDETPTAPIDGLIGLALAAGAWYGIRKLKK